MNDSIATPAGSWVPPRLVPLSTLDRAAAGASTFSVEASAGDTTYAPAS